MKVLAIDIGTSFVKGAILDVGARRIEEVRRVPFPEPVTGLPTAWVEIDPAAVTGAVDSLIAELGSSAGACEGVYLCGQMGGVILVDRDAQPRTNYLSWRDQRVLESNDSDGSNTFEQVRQRLTETRLAELGNELRPGSCTSLLFWLAEHEPSLLDGASPLSLPAFVVAHLIGKIPAEDATCAIGLLDLRGGGWHHEAFRALGLAVLVWPEVSHSRAAVGETRIGGRSVPCYAGVGDHQCALLGVGLGPDEISINVSTGSQVSRLTDSAAEGPFQVRHYFDGRLLQTITHLPAGRSLDGLVAFLTEIPRAAGAACGDVWSYVHEQVNAAGSSTLSADVSYFSGALGDQGSLNGMRLENMTVGHLFRAAFESMARNYAQCARRLDPQQSWQRIAFSGGLANRFEILRTLVLSELPGPYRLCADREDTLTGLLALALAADGQAESVIAASVALRSEATCAAANS
jgi:sugar (pentulose or hexulose) kinase